AAVVGLGVVGGGWVAAALTVGVVAVGGFPILEEAWEAVPARRMTMELSMTIALLAALAIGEFLTVLVIVAFVLFAEELEKVTVSRGRRAIEELLAFLPRRVFVRRDGEVREVDAEEVRPGDVVVVKPGSRVPVDGTVVAGLSSVDQSAITGESLPVEKVPGAGAYAGTMNQAGSLEIRTERLGRDTTFGQILVAVERAERTRAPIQKTADRLAGYLVYFTLAMAAITAVVTGDARATISVVIAAGACGIAAGTPLAILGAVGRSAREGAILKGGIALEVLGRADTVVLDKTGTLTFGRPEVVALRPAAGMGEGELLEAAAMAERPSEHPVARAILARAAGLPTRDPDRFESLPGMGVRATVDGTEILAGSRAFLAERGIPLPPPGATPSTGTEVLVARAGRLLGTIEVADALRPEAAEAVSALRAMGIRTLLLTGDVKVVAEEVGVRLGVDEVEAGMLPQDKLERVRALVKAGRTVAMVGDGVNDAPALVEASVGIAMGTGTDVARECAGAVLIGDDLMRLVETIRIARRCRRIIYANFAGTIGVDALAMALAAMGLLTPIFAAVVHVSSELAFILNSARLLVRPRPAGEESARTGAASGARAA
ncbi:MAG: cation-translocating P-type ATPase, partial [Planctomycetaceae bacterium]|nr:cation-translocating P-type ATPase [Planctomycetaceae bacterium]